jgi:hypothetical protein
VIRLGCIERYHFDHTTLLGVGPWPLLALAGVQQQRMVVSVQSSYDVDPAMPTQNELLLGVMGVAGTIWFCSVHGIMLAGLAHRSSGGFGNPTRELVYMPFGAPTPIHRTVMLPNVLLETGDVLTAMSPVRMPLDTFVLDIWVADVVRDGGCCSW